MIIAFGSDHAGFERPEPFYKPELIRYVESLGHSVIDCGTLGPESVDYPDYAVRVAQEILSGRAQAGILLCGTGIGMSITANRHKGIRAAVCTSETMARLAREHNHANVVCIGRRLLSLDECKRVISTFLSEPYSKVDRHQKRVAKMG